MNRKIVLGHFDRQIYLHDLPALTQLPSIDTIVTMKFSQLILTILSCALLPATHLLAESAYAGPKENLHIYLLIGQSNMAGRAAIPQEDAGPLENCYLLNAKDSWEVATNPFNRYSTIRKGLNMQKMNPGYTFAKVILEKQPGVSIGLVVNAKGGTKIEQWGKGTQFYKEAIRRAKEAQKTGVLKGILWHQGESNEGNPDGYLKQLESLVEDLRADLDSPELPFVAGQVINVPKINEQIAQLPDKVKNTAFVSSEGLKGQDRWHFNTESMKELGKRYADAMIKLNQ